MPVNSVNNCQNCERSDRFRTLKTQWSDKAVANKVVKTSCLWRLHHLLKFKIARFWAIQIGTVTYSWNNLLNFLYSHCNNRLVRNSRGALQGREPNLRKAKVTLRWKCLHYYAITLIFANCLGQWVTGLFIIVCGGIRLNELRILSKNQTILGLTVGEDAWHGATWSRISDQISCTNMQNHIEAAYGNTYAKPNAMTYRVGRFWHDATSGKTRGHYALKQ